VTKIKVNKEVFPMWDIETIQAGLTFGAIFSLCFIGVFFYIRNTTKITVINTLIKLIGDVEKEFGSGQGDIKKQIVLTKFYECIDKNLKGSKFYFIAYFGKYFITQKLLDRLIDEAVSGMQDLLEERKKAIETADKAVDVVTELILKDEAVQLSNKSVAKVVEIIDEDKKNIETLKKIADSDK
jgi:hypothetical protein